MNKLTATTNIKQHAYIIEDFGLKFDKKMQFAITPKQETPRRYESPESYLAKFTNGKHGKKPLSAQLSKPICTPSIFFVLLKIPT